MIILDTNVLSEIMKPTPSVSVLQWFNQHQQSEYFITSITTAEIYYGINRLPNGKRKEALIERFVSLLHEFTNNVLSFELYHSKTFGDIKSFKDSIGKPMDTADAQIASIVKYHEALLATRNVKDFENCDIDIVNPFQY